MKNIKTYVIGFLSATCLFLFMGQAEYVIGTNEIGQYQLETLVFDMGADDNVKHDVCYFIFDTKKGKVLTTGIISQFGSEPIGSDVERMDINHWYHKDF